jgi:hypothetical protein
LSIKNIVLHINDNINCKPILTAITQIKANCTPLWLIETPECSSLNIHQISGYDGGLIL